MTSEPIAPHRVAIYAAPDPSSAWWQRGSEWLGRCAAQRCDLPQPAIDGLSASHFAQLTADPRRYGWHATLKAPFRLAPETNLTTLRQALAAIARTHQAFTLADLQVARMGQFLALRPAAPPAALAALANDCVQRLQPLAAPLNAAELARRRRAPLTPEEDALLCAWGYPWVLTRFRLHFSLTGPLVGLTDAQVARIESAAIQHFDGLPPLPIDRLSIYIEPTPGANFTLLEQQALTP